ncbi:lipocalin family protein [Flavobacterium sp. W22_SRS_FK3]|uniref:lipocalin family protein n=1 Tax=Flavobacterium sp. W22_SRS_FK3 TaxID=3240275 RepID=UPI003F8FF418
MKTTKAIILTTLMVISTLFTSCSKDDSESPSIVGFWKTTSIMREKFNDGVSQGIQSNNVDANNYTILTFKKDGTFSYYEVSSNGESSTDSGTFTIKDNVLSIKYDEDEDADMDASTFTLTNETLVLTFIDEYTSGGIAIKNITTATLSRQ